MYRAVILEDEYIILEGLKTLIPWSDYGLELAGTAMDGISGFELILSAKPHVVITDIRMPGMNGLDIIEKVKYITPDTIFIIISGYADFQYARKAIELGVTEYLVKPVTVGDTAAVIRKAVGILDKSGGNRLPPNEQPPDKQPQPGEAIGGKTVRKSVMKVKSYIDANYSNDLTIFELAEIAGMNPSYFSVVFKAEMNISYIKYLTKVRMEKAEALLREGMKVTDVSLAVGYHNYQYFCEIFKKYHGMTAQQFKNR